MGQHIAAFRSRLPFLVADVRQVLVRRLRRQFRQLLRLADGAGATADWLSVVSRATAATTSRSAVQLRADVGTAVKIPVNVGRKYFQNYDENFSNYNSNNNNRFMALCP